MEALCKNVRKLSVASAAIKNAEKDSIEAFASSTAGGVTRPSFFLRELDSARVEYQFLQSKKDAGKAFFSKCVPSLVEKKSKTD